MNFILAVDYCPDADVKLSSFVKERPLDVFLHHTERPTRPCVYKMEHFLKVREYLDATTLVHVCWFDQPDVLFTMLHRQLLSSLDSTRELNKAI